MLLLIKYTLLYGIVLMLVALGGMFSEHSGVINIALEGIMVIGGLGGVLTVAMLQGTVPAWLLVALAIFVAALSGMVYALLLAFASINLKADQTIGGTALNMLATALAVILAKMYNGSTSSKVSYTNNAFLFKIGGLDLSVFIPLGIVLLIVSYIVMYKTRFGLRLRACGEHPQAADSVGINVYKMRYAGVLISGALAGLGGLVFIIPVSTNFNATVSGYGFLALAVLIFGQWKPWRIAGAALFFGLMKTISAVYSSIPFLVALGIPSNIYKMIPYVATLILLAFTGRTSQAPRAEGIPYDKGSR